MGVSGAWGEEVKKVKRQPQPFDQTTPCDTSKKGEMLVLVLVGAILTSLCLSLEKNCHFLHVQ